MEKFFGAVVDVIVEVEDAINRRMSDENVRIVRDSRVVTTLPVGNAIAHKHRHTIEFETVNFYD